MLLGIDLFCMVNSVCGYPFCQDFVSDIVAEGQRQIVLYLKFSMLLWVSLSMDALFFIPQNVRLQVVLRERVTNGATCCALYSRKNF